VSDDPYLQPGDAVVVPDEDFALGSISISGAVKMSGTYEYVPGDRIKDLLEISQGLTQVADSSAAEVFEWNGGGYTEKIVDLRDTSSLDMKLPVNSRVVVPIDRNKVHNYYVWVNGEVRVPGIYPISPDTTKLSDVIRMAGGFTRWASLPSAVVFRTKQPDVFTLPHPTNPEYFTNRASEINQEALAYASQELGMRSGREVVSTDFVKLFADKEEKYDVTLRAGDSIYVPQSQRAVYVFGQVRYPGYVDYRDGWTYSDYIAAAGGVTDGAQHGDIRILKHGTYQWYKPDDTHIEAGDLVFVPRVSIKPELYSWNLFKDIIGTVGSVASIALTAILVIRTAQGK
jgi:protein involved in polysaccharide export with SLBB domain